MFWYREVSGVHNSRRMSRSRLVSCLMVSSKNIKVIGIRHGEKMYETLLTNEECAHAIDLGLLTHRVPCDKRGLE
ncbi:MAG: polysaccharide biosynthesis protein [Enterocloster sp.]